MSDQMNLSMNKTIKEIIKENFGTGVEISERKTVFGGDINDSSLLYLSDGNKVFLKENTGKKSDFFKAEYDGLLALAKTGKIDVTHPIGYGTEGNRNFLLLDAIENGNKPLSFWECFGRKLALMHKADTASFVNEGKFGFINSNYIGATVQINDPCDSWIEFFRSRRLEVQFRMAWHYFDENDRKRIGRFLDRLDDLITDPSFPSLLHGDLWGGNFMCNDKGEPVLIDPAVYVGNAEADIAMTELFGGFSAGFYHAYKEENPFSYGYKDRRDIYNLYHILNHLNLFGGSYLPGVIRTIRHYS